MSISIRIPTPLRKYTGEQDVVTVEGSTVGDALANLSATFPELESKIFDGKGEVRRFVNIYANDEDVRFQDNLNTALNDGDTVSIVPAIAGGA